MPDASKTYIVNDQPTDKDALDFTPYVETLADIIQTGNTPLTIGVFGTWGSGKTSLMKMVKKNLPDDFTVAWFDAWKYDKEETLWRAFLLNVLFAVEKKSGETEELKTLKTMLYRGLEFEKTGGVTIDLAKLGAKVAEGAIQIGLSFIPPLATLADMAKELQKSGTGNVVGGFETAIQRERTKIYVEQVRSLEQFQDKFSKLVKSYIAPKRLVVFVDDLDRCMPEKAIEVLEAIKLFMDVENCIFALGVDQEVIARGIELKYKEFNYIQKDEQQRTNFSIEGLSYLEKIIQLPFQIPPVELSDMGDYVRGLSTDWPDDECPKVFAAGLGSNPRQIKRTVNTFFLLWKLAEKRKGKLQDRVKPVRLAKVVAIQAVFPDLYNLLLKNEPRYLRELEEHYRAETTKKFKTDKNDSVIWKSSMRTGTPPSLVPFLSRRGSQAVEKILTLHNMEIKDVNFSGLPIDELKLYFTLTARSETPRILSEIETNDLIFEPQMIAIPEGDFLMGSTIEQTTEAIQNGADQNWVKNETPQHTVYLSEYFIGKYPVTNLEYQAFIIDSKFKSPQGWEGDQFPEGKGGHPVVSVSWSDANMYCEWLSKKTGKPYRLPTEAEWEKASRGTDGRIYPWGNTFVVLMANTAETKIGDTSDVGKFSPQGDSPYGCADMVGNVWEWCNDWLDENEYRNRKETKNPQGPTTGSYRVLRGGSFVNNKGYCRCTDRGRYNPFNLGRNYGFRIAYTSEATETI